MTTEKKPRAPRKPRAPKAETVDPRVGELESAYKDACAQRDESKAEVAKLIAIIAALSDEVSGLKRQVEELHSHGPDTCDCDFCEAHGRSKYVAELLKLVKARQVAACVDHAMRNMGRFMRDRGEVTNLVQVLRSTPLVNDEDAV